MEFLIILGLILLNGIFSMAEMSLVSSRKFKLENAAHKGSKGAKRALILSENPTRFLSTIQMGITLIGILLGVYSGEQWTKNLSDFFLSIGIPQDYTYNLSVGIVVVCITYVSIVLGELLPKRIGMAYPEPIAIVLAKPMHVLSIITSPFVGLLTISNDLLLKILGIKRHTESKISEEEIKSIVKESAEVGEIQEIEQSLVERVFELGDRKVDTLFTHRSNIVYFNLDDSWETIQAKINKEKHSAYPVCENGQIDKAIGIVHLKDLFSPDIEKDFHVSKYIKEPLYLNENIYAYRVLELFKKEQIHYGIVIDEYGVTQGIVTMDDVMDALVSESTEMDEHEYMITPRNENSWFVDGQYSLLDFLKYFDLDVSDNIKNKFTTVAGLAIHKKKALPAIGDKISVGNYELEIVDKDGQRIDKILVTRKNRDKSKHSN